jgi:hypothetical protein
MRRKLIVIIAVLSMASCGEYEALEVRRESQNYADSLFRAHRDSLKIVFDSICDVNYPNYYKTGVDSFKVAQLEKIQRLINK